MSNARKKVTVKRARVESSSAHTSRSGKPITDPGDKQKQVYT